MRSGVAPAGDSRYCCSLHTVPALSAGTAAGAVVSGVNDAAAPTAFHEGDTGGYGNALPAFGSPTADDTTIHVVYACVAGSGSCATSNPAPQDAPATLPWTNGNGAP